MQKMNIRRLLLRSWFYFRFGYSTYLSLPTSLIAYASSVYYLAVRNVPFLMKIFPYFYVFIVVALVVMPPVSVVLAWMHFKKAFSPMFRAELDVGVESNPYAMTIVMPVNLPLFEAVSNIAKQQGIDTSELDKIIRATKKKFQP